MIDANAIRKGIELEFNDEFDFEAFDNYIYDFFVTKRMNHLEIGLDDDYRFKNTPNRVLSFIKGHANHIWTTDIQINRRYVPCVEKYLHDHGFSTAKKGACGYEVKDVLVVSI